MPNDVAGRAIGEPQRLPHVVGEDHQEDQRDVQEVAVDVLHDEREEPLAADSCFRGSPTAQAGGSAQNAL